MKGPPLIDLVGRQFGRLTVVEQSGKNKHGHHIWKCSCSCGNVTNVLGHRLRQGKTRSCGCLRREVSRTQRRALKHDMSRTNIYMRWARMNSHAMRDGPNVAKRWWKFENFYQDMGDIPVGARLTRKDKSKGFTPSNCEWRTSNANV